MLVWDAATLAQRRALPQPAGAGVRALMASGNAVWAGVGPAVVGWGLPGSSPHIELPSRRRWGRAWAGLMSCVAGT